MPQRLSIQKLCVLFSFTLCSMQAFAQYGETIRTGRPGQAIGPFTVGKGVFQNQSGFDLSNSSPKKTIEVTSDSYDFNSIFRYGLIENFEFSGVVTMGQDRITAGEQTTNESRFKQFDLGVRTNFVNETGLIPSIGFQYRMKIPTGVGEGYPKYLSSVITLVTSQHLTKNTGLATNWSVVWNGSTGEPTALYVFNLSQSLNDTWGIFTEYYGSFTDAYWIGNLDGGISYLVNKDLQLDTYGGFGGFGSEADTYFVSLGVSWRLVKNRS